MEIFMRFLNKSLFLGLGVGIALTLVVLDTWGRRLQQNVVLEASPWLLRPMASYRIPEISPSSERLPRPWLPGSPSQLHDNWPLRPLGGKPVTLADFRGKVVFLNFWSTSCGPCIAEMPGIERLQESLKGEPVAFLAVALDDEQRVLEFLKKHPTSLPVYLGGEALPADLTPGGFPTTFILNRRGETVAREVGGINWDDERARSYLLALARE
jgi:thiol-disulfide isomerase/thioredoxin